MKSARSLVRVSRRGGLRMLSVASSFRPALVPVARATPLAKFAGARAFSSFPPHVKLAMPALSPTMEKGTLAKWRKAVGDELAAGDVIAEVETDKATVDFECTDAGYLAAILIADGTSDVPVGQLVAIVVESKDALAAFAGVSAAQLGGAPAPAAAAPAAAKPAPAAAAAPSPAPSLAAAAPAGGRVFASPLARKLAEDGGLPLHSVPGTGPGGRVIAADVREAIARGPAVAAQVAAPAPAAAAPAAAAPSSQFADARSGFQDIPHSSMRRVIASRLTASKQTVPHYTLSMDVALDAVIALRASLNADLPADGKLSVNDFIVKASALALRKVPEVNASWMDNAIRSYHYVDVGVAVAVSDGLITPIIRDADAKGLVGISSGVRALVEKARARKLMPEDYQGGTFTVSNLGMFGIRSFSAIINPPQAAILAVGAAERRVVPGPDAATPFKQSVVLCATLSCDHRVVDGAVGAQWLSAFKGYLENPTTMLL